MKDAIIDWETYYDKEISVVELGTPNYVKAADGYIVGVMVDGEAMCGTRQEMLPIIDNISRDPSVRPVAANANFDQAWTEKYVPPFQRDWHCILDHAAFHQCPRNLAGLSGAVLGEKVDKTMRDEMKGKRYEELPAEEQQKVQEYCLNDVIKEHECLQKLAPMSAIEEKVAAHTRAINRRGVCINMDLVESDKTRLEAMRFEAFKSIPWHNDSPPLSYQALARYCGSKNLPVPKSLAKTDEECTELMSDCAELAEVIGFLRRYRRTNTMLRKVESLMARVTDENILALDLLYCGAPHTRRWSSKGFNVQNLDKEPLVTVGTLPEGFGTQGHPGWKDVYDGTYVMPAGIEWVWTRSWLRPRPGHVFLILDYSQIEPRCLNWLAGNEDMMEALRHGFSYYEAYVTAAKQQQRVGWSGKAGTLKKEVGIAKYTKIKNESLGCGYGMGAGKYTTYAKVEPEEAQAVVDGFRKGNPKIVQFWRKLDNLIASASRDKAKHLALQMPSGDFLQHFSVRSNRGGFESFTVKGDFSAMSKQPRLWGGTLCENVTQRMARDVLANSIVNLEEAGLRVAFHCHDEVILEVPIDSKEEAEKEAHRILKTAPEWANDLPLGVEGGFAEAYTK